MKRGADNWRVRVAGVCDVVVKEGMMAVPVGMGAGMVAGILTRAIVPEYPVLASGVTTLVSAGVAATVARSSRRN